MRLLQQLFYTVRFHARHEWRATRFTYTMNNDIFCVMLITFGRTYGIVAATGKDGSKFATKFTGRAA